MLLRFVGFTDPARAGQPTAVDGYGLWLQDEIKNVQDDLGRFLLYGEHFVEAAEEELHGTSAAEPASSPKGKKATSPGQPASDQPASDAPTDALADTTVTTPTGDSNGSS